MSDVDRTTPSADAPQKPSPVAIGSDAPSPSRPTRPTGPGGALRALVAGLITAIMLVATLGVAVFAQTGRTVDGPTFLPATAVAYAEVRLDLPGDQRENLMAFLGHIPGFADPALFDTKLDETIDQLLGGSDSPISWSEDIKPWFGGPVMVGLSQVPPMGAATTEAESAPIVVALASTDRAALDASLAKLLGAMDDTLLTEEHAGTTITSVDSDGSVTALAPTDELLLLSNDVDEIRSALDVLAGDGPSLADDPAYQAAMGALPTDRLGAFYVDTLALKDALLPFIEQQLAAQPQMGFSAEQLQAGLAMLPPSLTGVIRVDADHLTFRIAAPVADGGPVFTVRSTDLASKMPGDTIVYLETRDLGAGIKALVEQLKPMLAQQGNDKAVAQIEALLGTGLESYLDWVGDAAVAASLSVAGPTVGIAATVTDEATGQQRIDSLLALIRVIASTADPSPVVISQEDVNGVTVTTISLAPGVSMPQDLPVEPTISLAIGDGHFYLGLGDFAKQALSRDAADSLASSPGYIKAVAAAGEENAGMLYVDVASALSFATLLMGSDDLEMFETQIMPYADVLDFVVASLNLDGTSSSVSLMLFVK